MTVILSLIALNALASPGMPAALSVEAAAIDRGELKAGAPLTQAFKFTNRSLNQTVEIVGIKVSCGCAKSSFDKARIKPGETATLTVQVNTIAQVAGPWVWTATVRYKYAGDSVEESLPVRMTGTLVREVTLSPPGLAFSLESGSVSQEVTLADSRPRPLTILGAAATSPFLKATLQPTDKPGQTRLAVTVVENAPLGDHSETIVLATNDPLYPELRVPVRVTKKSPAKVKVDPEGIYVNYFSMRMSPPPPVYQHKLYLRRADGKNLKIERCEINTGNITMTWSKDLGLSAMVIVKMPDSLRNEAGQATLKIILTEPAGETVIVPVEWKNR